MGVGEVTQFLHGVLTRIEFHGFTHASGVKTTKDFNRQLECTEIVKLDAREPHNTH